MKWGKVILVVFGAIIITALGIDASDTISGKDGTLLSRVLPEKSKCPYGMVSIENIPGVSCVDQYEASTGNDCPVKDPQSLVNTIQNIEDSACVPESKQNSTPWRFITREQAMQSCARVGKRVPTSEEWYVLALGMIQIHESCNISSHTIAQTGSFTSCSTAHGVFDMVGNVWEWVSDDVINGIYNTQELPNEGYVAQVDQTGMATVSSEIEQQLFGSDYFWSDRDGAYGIIRGGYYDSGIDAGIYTAHAGTRPTAASVGIGFRCVQ